MLMRWLNEIQKYEFSIAYRSGKRNGNADALSRLVEELPDGDDEPGEEEIGFINAIRLGNDAASNEQMEDLDLAWLIGLKKFAQTEKVERVLVQEFANDAQRSLYSQWSRIRLSKETLYRE